MARQDADVWAVIGSIGAIALGVALIPLRSSVSASNLAFVFLILTILVAELGGRAAGLVTAVMSALSLNFFLTQPYLTLTIERTDDIVAFVALAVSGLVAAAFGQRRARSSELVRRAREGLAALDQTAENLVQAVPLEKVLEGLRRPFRLEGLVLRHIDGRVVCSVPPGQVNRAAPAVTLEPRTLLGTDERWHRLGSRGFRLPEGGGRFRLATDGESLVLDLWEGDDEGLSADERRALTAAIGMLTLALCPRPTSSPRIHLGDR